MQGCAPCMAVVFLLAQKDDRKMRMRGGFRFPPLMTFPLKRHKRGVRAPLGLPPRERETDEKGLVPQGADALSFRAERGIPHSEAYAVAKGDSSALARLRMTAFYIFSKSHKSTRGARKQRNHNTTTSDSHGSNDKRSGLTTRKADYKGGSPCFLFGDFFKSEKATRCRTESCIPRPPRDENV
jgi:hypothetical protein